MVKAYASERIVRVVTQWMVDSIVKIWSEAKNSRKTNEHAGQHKHPAVVLLQTSYSLPVGEAVGNAGRRPRH